jgi:hypothetical protein
MRGATVSGVFSPYGATFLPPCATERSKGVPSLGHVSFVKAAFTARFNPAGH